MRILRSFPAVAKSLPHSENLMAQIIALIIEKSRINIMITKYEHYNENKCYTFPFAFDVQSKICINRNLSKS